MRSRAWAEGLSLGICIIILYPVMVLSQAGQDLQKQLDELKLRLKQLENENQMLRSSARTADSLLYCSIRLEIFDAFTKVQQIEFDFESTTDKIAVTGLFAKLMEANNPASDILGFRFYDLVLKAAEKHFFSRLRDEKDKNRFSQIILKVIDNPLVSSLARSNPLTWAVSGIINAVIGFTTSEVNIEKEGGRIKDVDVLQEDSFNSEDIAGFREDLQVYISFYDNLIAATDKYLSDLEFLKSKYAHLMSSLAKYKEDLYSYPGSGKDNYLASLTLLLPEPGNSGIEYETLLKHPGIQKCLMNARKFPVLELSVSEFKKEYDRLLFHFLSEYISTLKLATGFPDIAIEKARTESLISEIEIFIKDQELVPDKHPDVSEN